MVVMGNNCVSNFGFCLSFTSFLIYEIRDKKINIDNAIAAFFPEDEFNALRTGVPLARYISDLKKTNPQIDVFAHSMGNMVVHSALMRSEMTDNALHSFFMNEAAVAAEAFDSDYVYSDKDPKILLLHASMNGYSDDKHWNEDWDWMQKNDNGCGIEYCSPLRKWEKNIASTYVSPAPKYYLRWGQKRPSGIFQDSVAENSIPQRGPWKGFFANNLARHISTKFVNSFNMNDRALNFWWYSTQISQKPNVGPFGFNADDMQTQFWAQLSGPVEEQFYLWTDRGDKSNIVRQWQELAHWFPAISRPIGIGASDVFNSNNNQNKNFTSFGTTPSETEYTHSYLRMGRFYKVWPAFDQMKEVMK